MVSGISAEKKVYISKSRHGWKTEQLGDCRKMLNIAKFTSRNFTGSILGKMLKIPAKKLTKNTVYHTAIHIHHTIPCKPVKHAMDRPAHAGIYQLCSASMRLSHRFFISIDCLWLSQVFHIHGYCTCTFTMFCYV